MNDKILHEMELLEPRLNYRVETDNEYIERFITLAWWEGISSTRSLSEDFIREFQNYVYWPHICQYQILSEDFIEEFKDKVDWICISCCQILSEDFIRKFKDRVYWNYIPYWQKLSMSFIKEFQDTLDWHAISYYQFLSKEFILEFKNKLNKDSIIVNKIIWSQLNEEPFKSLLIDKEKIKEYILNSICGTKKECPQCELLREKAIQDRAKLEIEMEIKEVELENLRLLNEWNNFERNEGYSSH